MVLSLRVEFDRSVGDTGEDIDPEERFQGSGSVERVECMFGGLGTAGRSPDCSKNLYGMAGRMGHGYRQRHKAVQSHCCITAAAADCNKALGGADCC